MEKLFREYRCTTCRSLLLKGCVFQGFLEMKCRRCKRITCWGGSEAQPYVVMDSNTEEEVVRVSGEVESVFGCEKEYVIGKRLRDILEHITRSVPVKNQHAKWVEKEMYNIPDNHLVLHDGDRRPVRSYAVPRREKGRDAGKRVFIVPVKDGCG